MAGRSAGGHSTTTPGDGTPERTDLHILIVDDAEANVLLLRRLLEREGYTRLSATTSSAEVLERFEQDPPDLLLLDLHMPDPDGFAVLEALRPWTRGTAYIPVLVLTADVSQASVRRALTCGARDYVAKPIDTVEVAQRVANLLETRRLHLHLQTHNLRLEELVRRRTAELDEARMETLQRLAIAAEFRDDDTRDHTQRVGRLASTLASELGVDPAMTAIIGRVAPLHDLGKIAIPDAILLKPGRLDPDELSTMRQHAAIGAEILSGTASPWFATAREIALTHHERWDGTGYPRGLAGEAIPLSGRIVAVADAFDAMTHDRPYKAAMSLPEALDEVQRSTGSHFDPGIARTFGDIDRPRLERLLEGSAAAAEIGWGAVGRSSG